MRSREEIVERARRHVGHREVTPNRSPLIDEWIRRCKLDPAGAYPWCAAFASWCIEDRAERKLGGTLPVAEAGALRLGRSFPATTEPQPGDLMYFPTDDKGAGHIGIVVGVDPEEVLCIEGNSKNQVRIVRRLRSEVRFSSTRVEVWDGPGSNADWAEPWRKRFELVRVSKDGTR
jgi:uncharacterized protein (TIGR02594 family)